MARIGLLLATTFTLVVCGAHACKFRDYKVIPDVISEAPTSELKVSYPSGVKASYGNELTPTEVKDMPKVQADVEKESYYTLALVDPDVPSRKAPVNGQWIHWLVINIPGTSFQDGDVSDGHTMAEYIGSAPPEGTHFHRYVFLVYKQDGVIEPRANTISATSAQGRPKFNITNYAKENNLGPLVAGNFYQAQYDDYVPIIYSMITN